MSDQIISASKEGQDLIERANKSGKFCILLNSHSLHNFQLCEMKHLLGDIVNLAPEGEKQAFQRGTDVAKLLEVFYHRRRKGRSLAPIVTNIHLWTKRFMRYSEPDMALRMTNTIMTYFREYGNETMEVVATEKAFSKVIYEDDKHLFIYEGRPDLVAKMMDGTIQVWDHKTQARKDNIYFFNNQSMGYCWGLDTLHFGYNYLVFTKENQVRREVVKFSQAQIDQWRNDTIEWYFRIANARQNRKFLRSWNCQGKYGVCEFAPICEAPTESLKLWVIKSQYGQAEKMRMSW